MPIVTIDCAYTGQPEIAAAYLMHDGEHAAFVETNTTRAVPLLLEGLAQEGLRPEQVELVIVTHIHLDHAGGAGALMAALPNATLLAHPKAAPHAVDPTRIVRGATEVYGETAFQALYGAVTPVAAERVRAMGDGEQLAFAGRTLTFLHTRGHANHHFCVHDDREQTVFTGDSFGIVYPVLQRNGPFAFPSTTPTDFDAEAAHASIDRILATGATSILPTHFGRHTALATFADQLHRQLDDHAAIVDEADRSARDGDDLDTFCAEAVEALFHTELLHLGLASDAAARSAVGFDAKLNAQGLAFAVRKRRYKRNR